MGQSIFKTLAFLAAIMLVYGCVQQAGPIAEEGHEELVDTGAIIIYSSPTQAEVYMGSELKGITPLELYNIPVGAYNIKIKKEGYEEIERIVEIKVGKTEEIEATLAELAPAKPVEEQKTEEAKPAEKMPDAPASKLSKINLSSFAMYWDFEGMQFTEVRTSESDLFSRRYDSYIDFVALVPAKIMMVNKPINDIKKDDCISANDGVAQVYSKQTLCVKTGEGLIAALGGSWEKTVTELEWTLLS